MKNKSENYFKEYLGNISNDQLIQFYNDLEWTPFPVLVLKEYQNRFKTKNKKEVLKKLKEQAQVARTKTRDLRKLAKTRGSKIKTEIKTKSKKLAGSISEAKLISTKRNLEILEKLDKLNKKGIITNKEFQDKKKEILKRI